MNVTRLNDVSLANLYRVADLFDGHRAFRRLYAAILYKQGVPATTISTWFDVRPATVYAWFDRLEAKESLEAAVQDEPRPGRPPKLSDVDREEFLELLSEPPTATGLDARDWSPKLARELLQTRYGVDYSVRHVRRLLSRAETDET